VVSPFLLIRIKLRLLRRLCINCREGLYHKEGIDIRNWKNNWEKG
jgi:hypothetical protein